MKISCARTLVDGTFRPSTLVVDAEGRITDVLDHQTQGENPQRVDEEIQGVLLPGLVDTHVHINEPGRTEWEGFQTATRAAAAGGVTTLVDMPLNCIPVTTTRAALEIKRAAAEGQLAVDVGFWGGVIPGNAGELAAMASLGMLGAKAFLCHSGIDDFPRSTDADLRAAMPVLRDAGVPLLVHAELELPGAPACGGDVRSYETYLRSRPREWEDAAIALMIRLCRETRCAVHIVHLSSASALPLIRAAKDEGLPFTVETCPHYLCLTSEGVPEGATEYKCAPPIREDVNREALWMGLEAGVIDFVTSDHSPCTPALKKPLQGDFCGAWGGIASLSLGLSSLWSQPHARVMGLERIVDLLTRRPAALAGIQKGEIRVGADADLVAFDPDADWTVARENLPFRHPVSPWIGRSLRGRVKKTWLRGQVVYDDGAHVPGLGRTVRKEIG